MAKSKPKNEEAARVCVCGSLPVTVKHGKLYMLACPDSMRCTVRGQWAPGEQAAIKSWNTEIEILKSEKA